MVKMTEEWAKRRREAGGRGKGEACRAEGEVPGEGRTEPPRTTGGRPVTLGEL